MKLLSGYMKKPSVRGLFLSMIFLVLLSVLPVSLFRIGYKFNNISKELVLILILNILSLFFLLDIKKYKIRLSYFFTINIVLFFVATFFWKLDFHSISLVSAYLLVGLLIYLMFETRALYLVLFSVLLVILLASFFQFWSMAYGVAPNYIKLIVSGPRMSGVLGQANITACAMVIGFYSWLMLLSSEGFVKKPKGARVFYALPLSLFVWGLFLTGSKAGILSLVLSLLVLLFFLYRRNANQDLKYFCSISMKALLVAFILFFSIKVPFQTDEYLRGVDFSSGQAGTMTRIIFYFSAILIGADNFWFGSGLGGFRRLLGAYAVDVSEFLSIPYDHISETIWAHNDFLQIFAEFGITGLFVLSALVVYMCVKLFTHNTTESSLLIATITAFLIFMQFGHPINDHVLAFVFVTILAICGNIARKRKDTAFLLNKKYLVSVFLLALCFVNIGIIRHIYKMNRLQAYQQSVAALDSHKVSDVKSLRKIYDYDVLVDDPVYGWRFKYFQSRMWGKLIVDKFDRELADFFVPEVKMFLQNSHSYEIEYTLARILFIKGDYAEGAKRSMRAFSMKPDEFSYANFSHLCNVMHISRENNIEVFSLIDRDHLYELLDSGVLRRSLFDDNWRAI